MIFMPFPRFVAPISAPPPLAITKVASMKHSSSSSAPLSRSSLATSVSSRRKTSTPSLKAPMYRFVVGIALRQHMRLRTCVEKPQDCFKNATCRDRLASGTTIGNVLLRKMIPDPLHNNSIVVVIEPAPSLIYVRLRASLDESEFTENPKWRTASVD